MKRTAIMISAILTVFSAGVIAGDDTMENKRDKVTDFEQLNQDRDNTLSEEEFNNASADADVAFSDLDANGDNEVSREEYFDFYETGEWQDERVTMD